MSSASQPVSPQDFSQFEARKRPRERREMASKALIATVLVLVALVATSPSGIDASRAITATILMKPEALEMSTAMAARDVPKRPDENCIPNGDICMKRPWDCCGSCDCIQGVYCGDC
uniref:U2-theraphotoxin-Pc1a n=1 Tax=Anthurium amnicola TaxID=1678845 RepID=A0A1D1ZF13_9ARAE